MAAYNINKGVNARVEFHGLRAQYLYLFAGGLLGLFLLFVAMYLAGLSAGVCIFVCSAAGAALVWGVFRLNSRYGQYGMMKLLAGLRLPRRIIRRRRIGRLIRITNHFDDHAGERLKPYRWRAVFRFWLSSRAVSSARTATLPSLSG